MERPICSQNNTQKNSLPLPHKELSLLGPYGPKGGQHEEDRDHLLRAGLGWHGFGHHERARNFSSGTAIRMTITAPNTITRLRPRARPTFLSARRMATSS